MKFLKGAGIVAVTMYAAYRLFVLGACTGVFMERYKGEWDELKKTMKSKD